VLLAFCLLPRACSFADEPNAGTVISITDGDTVIVAHDGTPEKVRLADVDSPEKTQPYGRAAKRFISDLIYLQKVRIIRRGTDKYGRTLATLFLKDGTNVNEALLRNGYAWIYRAKSKNPVYRRSELAARDRHVGLWADPHPEAPWDYRKAQKEPAKPEQNDFGGLIRQLLGERVGK
jgi:micrococcal nuclease